MASDSSFDGIGGIVRETEGIHGLDERANADAIHGQIPIWMEMLRRLAS